ncbi:conserved hypothetical protein [Paecilomyces variotii No. 5]|uniref:Uncharacterized protein n=1 Tax=Byssochlamys spectabilis (strain No. 5 / NBRC 109023) TaxID=1356009 RepID=V5GDS1_BYSSN|nr:conserved hypothetical protein [Paecilomyces variotii No. 5]
MPVIPSNPNDLVPNNQGGNSQQTGSGESSKEHAKATAKDHLSKGPQIPDQMPPKASREEIEARMKDLNK